MLFLSLKFPIKPHDEDNNYLPIISKGASINYMRCSKRGGDQAESRLGERGGVIKYHVIFFPSVNGVKLHESEIKLK